MRSGVPYGLKFLSRFFLEIVPAVLACVIGGFLFVHYYTGSPTPEANPVGTVSAVPPDRLAAMVDEEHAQVVDFLKQGRAAAKVDEASAGPAARAKPRIAAREAASRESVVRVRRAPPPPLGAEAPPRPQPSVAAANGLPPSAPPLRAASNPVPPADIPNAALQTAAAPAVPPQAAAAERAPPGDGSDKQGVFGSVLSKASEMKDKAIEFSRVREAIDFVRDIPGRVLPSRDKSSDVNTPGAPQKFSQTSAE